MDICIRGTAMYRRGEADDLESHFKPRVLRRMPLYIRSGLAAATSALQQAHLFPCPPDMALIIGSAYSCQETAFDFMDSIIRDGAQYASPLSFSHSVNNVASGLISMCLGIQGSCYMLNNQAESFCDALQLALCLLKSGRNELILAGYMEEDDARLAKVLPNRNTAAYSYFVVLQKFGCHD